MSIAVKIEAQYEEFITATKALKEVFGGAMDGMKAELHAMSEQAKADMKGHESASEQFANILKSNMKGVTGAVEGVKIAWAQLAVIFEAANFLREAVTDTVKMTTEAQKLGRTLGISATQASVLNVALGDVYGTTDQYVAIAKGMDQQLKKNERQMNAFGLETRDAGGHLKSQNALILDGLEVLRGYKEGTDRNIAASVLFGRSVNVSSEMLALNAEKMAAAKEKAEALGLVVGSDDVEASNKFRAAMNDMHDIIDAVMKAVGSALLPVLNDLGTWFSEYGPQALLAIKVAISIVISLFHGLAFAVKSLWALCVMAFDNMVAAGRGFAEVFTKLFAGDFAGALDAAKSTIGATQANVGAAFDKIMQGANDTRDSLAGIWKPLIDGPGPVKDSGVATGGADADTSKLKTPHKKHDNSAAEARKAAAEAKRLAKEEYDAKMEAMKGEEQAAKENLEKLLEIQQRELVAAKAMYGEKSKQAEAAANRIAETERKLVEQKERLSLMEAESQRTVAAMRIDQAEKAAQTEVELGRSTHAQLLQQEYGFEVDRFQLQMDQLQDEANANMERIEDHKRTLLKMQELSIEHQGRMGQIAMQAAINAAQPMLQLQDTVANGFGNTVNGMLAHTMSLRQGLGQLFQQITQNFVMQETKKLTAYLFGQRAQTGATLAGNAVRTASDLMAAKKSVAATAMAATKNIMSKAAEVFANVYNAIAGIPYVGPFLAPVMAVAATGAVIGYVSHVASAEGGYDIPAGVNPVTQLHEKEMVLPARQAEVIRDMADGGAKAQSAPGNTTIVAHDVQGFRDYIRRNPGAVVDGLMYANRRGYGTAGPIKL